MTEANPACPIMTADCPPENECRLHALESYPEMGNASAPNRSCYRYACLTCGSQWIVKFDQVQPFLDRHGKPVSSPPPYVERI